MDAMRLLDPRLLRQAGSARGYLAVTVALGLVGAVLILFQADLLSRALAGAARGTGIAALSGVLAWLGVAVAGRAVAAARGEAAALRAAAMVKSGLRRRLSAHVLRLGPQFGGQPRGEITTLATRGLDVLAATAGRTMLLITHDLDGLDEFDQVITLEGGKIADVYLLRDPGSGSSATRYPSRLRGAQCIPAGGPDRAARFTRGSEGSPQAARQAPDIRRPATGNTSLP
jgi:ABC-type multidrug transport system fused ATPase/permease subunit